MRYLESSRLSVHISPTTTSYDDYLDAYERCKKSSSVNATDEKEHQKIKEQRKQRVLFEVSETKQNKKSSRTAAATISFFFLLLVSMIIFCIIPFDSLAYSVFFILFTVIISGICLGLFLYFITSKSGALKIPLCISSFLVFAISSAMLVASSVSDNVFSYFESVFNFSLSPLLTSENIGVLLPFSLVSLVLISPVAFIATGFANIINFVNECKI